MGFCKAHLGLHWDYIRFRDLTPRLEEQMEKTIDNCMKTETT